jgi:hypothetical protein
LRRQRDETLGDLSRALFRAAQRSCERERRDYAHELLNRGADAETGPLGDIHDEVDNTKNWVQYWSESRDGMVRSKVWWGYIAIPRWCCMIPLRPFDREANPLQFALVNRQLRLVAAIILSGFEPSAGELLYAAEINVPYAKATDIVSAPEILSSDLDLQGVPASDISIPGEGMNEANRVVNEAYAQAARLFDGAGRLTVGKLAKAGAIIRHLRALKEAHGPDAQQGLGDGGLSAADALAWESGWSGKSLQDILGQNRTVVRCCKSPTSSRATRRFESIRVLSDVIHVGFNC